jgi:hypothetical protein
LAAAGLTTCLLSFPATAVAADPAQVFERFDLIGTWSPDCSLPPSPWNPRVTYRNVFGQVLHTVTFDGRTIAVRDQVGTALAVGTDGVVFTVVRNGRPTLTVTLKFEFGRVHSDRSVGVDGHVYVDHGIDLSTGLPVLEDEMCAAANS